MSLALKPKPEMVAVLRTDDIVIISKYQPTAERLEEVRNMLADRNVLNLLASVNWDLKRLKPNGEKNHDKPNLMTGIAAASTNIQRHMKLGHTAYSEQMLMKDLENTDPQFCEQITKVVANAMDTYGIKV